jgi:methionyl-tRNA synthetase
VSKFYLTTAIDYSNGEPHLGHALEKLGADAIARYRRLRGDEVYFVMGMDEHSQSVIQAAARTHVSPQAWVDRMADVFADYWRRLHCSQDRWIRTTEPAHARAVVALLERIRRNRPQDIYEADYEGLYCTGCEEFKTGSQIVDNRCVEHPSLELVPTKERNHFFRLSRYRDAVLASIQSGAFHVEPEIRRNEVLSLLAAGLQDISISRQRQAWGIPFPGDPNQTVYVWFDALINYLTAATFPEPGYERWWPADLHVVGKGITRFHCVIWPAMLLAAELPLPRGVWAHGYVRWGGTKLSKTAGTAVSLGEAIAYRGPDALRYFLLREIGFESDGDFTWDRFEARYTAELADTVGNLVSRSLSMIVRYRDGVVPEAPVAAPLEDAAQDALARYARAMDSYALQDAAAAWISLAAQANRYVEETAPWHLARRGDAASLDAVLANLARTVARLAILGQPFVPASAAVIWDLLGTNRPLAAEGWGGLAAPALHGRRVARPPVLFPKEAPEPAGTRKGVS